MSLQFKGLILCKCPTCNKVYPVFSEEVRTKITCKKCNTDIDLPEEATGLFCSCECGRNIRAVTNCTDDIFEFECKCGYPLTVEYHRAKKRYGGIK